jgi:hypothetical protein
MEKIAFLVSPDPESLMAILQKVGNDLSFLLLVYEWSAGRFKLALENLFSYYNSMNLQQLSQTVVNAIHILLHKEERLMVQQQIQRRMILAVDNFF